MPSQLENLTVWWKVLRPCMTCGARLIVNLARSGRTSHLIAKYRPSVPVFMVVVDEAQDGTAESVARRALVYRGIYPMAGAYTRPLFSST